MKTKVKLVDGNFYYVGNDNELTLVPYNELKNVMEKVKYLQVDTYASVCEEQSSAVREGKVYEISDKTESFNLQNELIWSRTDEDGNVLKQYTMPVPA